MADDDEAKILLSANPHLSACMKAAPNLLSASGAWSNRAALRERVLASLVSVEEAHDSLLSKCGLSNTASVERHDSQRKAIPACAPPSAPARFFGKTLKLPKSGLPVRAHADVPDAALFVAADRVGRMLRAQSPAVHQRLERSDASIHIVGRKQSVSDLPEHRHLRGRRGDYADEALNDPRRVERYGIWAERSDDGRSFRLPLLSPEHLTIDERTRGMGGTQASCGEENLLGVDVDPRYRNRDILSHEFAHTLMDIGLPPAARTAIEACFESSVVQKGLWLQPSGKRAYAGTNPQEYFAELSMWYLGSHGEFVDRDRELPRPGPRGLQSYDPDGFELIGSIFDGTHPALQGDKIGPPPVRIEPVEEEDAARVGSRRYTVKGEEMEEPARECTLEIVAGPHEPVSIAWIDGDGERHEFGEVEPGGRRTQRTYSGHVWEVAGKRYRANGEHEAQRIDAGADS